MVSYEDYKDDEWQTRALCRLREITSTTHEGRHMISLDTRNLETAKRRQSRLEWSLLQIFDNWRRLNAVAIEVSDIKMDYVYVVTVKFIPRYCNGTE
jgi:hypothetical protein